MFFIIEIFFKIVGIFFVKSLNIKNQPEKKNLWVNRCFKVYLEL